MTFKTVKYSHRFSSQLSCREVHRMVDDRDSVFGRIAPRSAGPVEIELVVLRKVASHWINDYNNNSTLSIQKNTI